MFLQKSYLLLFPWVTTFYHTKKKVFQYLNCYILQFREYIFHLYAWYALENSVFYGLLTWPCARLKRSLQLFLVLVYELGAFTNLAARRKDLCSLRLLGHISIEWVPITFLKFSRSHLNVDDQGFEAFISKNEGLPKILPEQKLQDFKLSTRRAHLNWKVV